MKYATEYAMEYLFDFYPGLPAIYGSNQCMEKLRAVISDIRLTAILSCHWRFIFFIRLSRILYFCLAYNVKEK